MQENISTTERRGAQKVQDSKLQLKLLELQSELLSVPRGYWMLLKIIGRELRANLNVTSQGMGITKLPNTPIYNLGQEAQNFQAQMQV